MPCAHGSPGVENHAESTAARWYREGVSLFSLQLLEVLVPDLVHFAICRIEVDLDLSLERPEHLAAVSDWRGHDPISAHTTAATRDDDVFAAFDGIQQLRELALRLVHIDNHHLARLANCGISVERSGRVARCRGGEEQPASG